MPTTTRNAAPHAVGDDGIGGDIAQSLRTLKMNTTKKQSAVETAINGTILMLTFANGQSLAVDSAALNPSIVEAATLHGLKQKLCDAAAINRDPATGKPATIATKYEAVREVFDRITSPDGTWNKIREGGNNSGGLLLTALVRMYAGRKTRDDLTAFLASKTDAEKAALRKNAKIAAIIEEIRAERATDDEGVDSDAILEELND